MTKTIFKILLNKYVIVAMMSSFATYQVIEPNTITKIVCKNAIYKVVRDLRSATDKQNISFKLNDSTANE